MAIQATLAAALYSAVVPSAKNLNVNSAQQSQHIESIESVKCALPVELINSPLAEKLAAALYMAKQAGQSILAVRDSKNLDVEIKADNTPVTQADHASNAVLCGIINQTYPKDGILSEEAITGGISLNKAIEQGVEAEWTWVLDPLDGTKAFMVGTGLPSPGLDPRYKGTHFGIHIGLLHQGQPVLGVNYYPAIQTAYFASDGLAYKQVENCFAEQITNQPIDGIKPVLNPTQNEIHMVGKIYAQLMGEEAAATFAKEGLFLDSFGYKMISIAEGNGCNLYIAPPKGPGFWDVCSMIPLIEAVKGGQVIDWEGNSIDFRDMSKNGFLPKGAIISTDPNLNKQIVEIIRGLIEEGHLPVLRP